MDQSLLLIINREWTNSFLDRVMAISSSLHFWMPLLVLIGILVLIFGGFRGRTFLLTFALCILVVDGLCVNFGKRIFPRPRPPEVLTEIREVDLVGKKPAFIAGFLPLKIEYSAPGVIATGGRSFPSGHTANNFAIAMLLFVFYRRWGWLYFIPATIVAYSRIYVGAHWPSDVLVSAFLGSAVSLLIIITLQAFWKNFGKRFLPSLYSAHPHLISP
ncbi:MAG: phosphatase PAP2 family protein [Chthoniobacterales bacterium]